jgi:hypothetical protein
MLGKISSLGYRRWYEKALIESHAWLVTGLLCLVVGAAGLELISGERVSGKFLLDGLLIAAGFGGAWVCWRSYAKTMILAETVGAQANCPQCRRLGFKVVQPAPSLAVRPVTLQVVCPKCQAQWKVSIDSL